MQVTVNGVATDVAEDTTVAALVAERGGRHDRIAVARNGDVVPRSCWAPARCPAWCWPPGTTATACCSPRSPPR